MGRYLEISWKMVNIFLQKLLIVVAKYIQLNRTFYLFMLLRFSILTIGPINVNKNEIAYIDGSELLFYRPSVQRFLISHGTNTRFAEWNHGCLGEKIFREFIKNNMLRSLLWCVWRYQTLHYNMVEHVLKKCGHSERPSRKSGRCSKRIFAWSWRYSTKWNDSNET